MLNRGKMFVNIMDGIDQSGIKFGIKIELWAEF